MIRLKLKYKKLVLFISVGTICIGGIAYTIVNRSAGNDKKQEIVNELSVTDSNFTSATYDSSVGEITLEKNAYPEINALVKKYFEARANCDMDTLGTLVSDIQYVNEDELSILSTYVEGYKNIDCYTAPGAEEGSYVVLVYSDLKMKDVDTLAPGLTGLYVKTDSNGNYVIYNGVSDEKETVQKEAVYACEGVTDLIAMIETKYQEALDSDPDLVALYTQLQQQASQPQTDSETETETSEKPEVSETPEATSEAE